VKHGMPGSRATASPGESVVMEGWREWIVPVVSWPRIKGLECETLLLPMPP
jgi:hypothetical protein